MRNRIINVFNSSFSEISLLVISCSLAAIGISTKLGSQALNVETAAAIIGGIALFFLLIWATVTLIRRKYVKEMPAKTRVIVECVSYLMILLWLCMGTSPVVALIWALLFIWNIVRGVKQAYFA